MKYVTMSIVMLVILLFIAPSALAEEAPVMYIAQADGSCDCGEEAEVDLMVNVSETTTGVQVQVEFDPICVNITDVNFTGSPWQPLVPPGWGHNGSHIRAATLNTDGVDPGLHKFATITVNCTGCNCTSDINLTDVVPESLTVYNSTFTCGEAQKDAEPCLGSCYADPNCTEIVAENISCCECVASGFYWHPNLDESCFGNNTPEDLCLDWCPECVDCEDNDNDSLEDYPLDPECTCGLDPSERAPLPPIPEAGTIILTGLGLGGLLVGYGMVSIIKKAK